MIGMTGTTVGTRAGTDGKAPDADEVPDDDEELLPPPTLVSNELTDATEDAIAEARIAPKAGVVDIVVRRLSYHSEI